MLWFLCLARWLHTASHSLRLWVCPITQVAGPHPFNFIPANREKTLTGVWDDNAVQPRLVPDQINR